jgi:hypothetical protein
VRVVERYIKMGMFSLALVFSCFGCKKNNTEINKVPLNKTDTIIRLHSINTELYPYFNYKDGSYWVYSDTLGNIVDSLYLADYIKTTDSIKTFVTSTLYIDIYENIRYSLKSTQTPNQNFYFGAVENQIGAYTTAFNSLDVSPYPIYYFTQKTLCTNENYDSHVYNTRNCKVAKDTVHLGNGKSYANVTLIIHQADGVLQVTIHKLSPPLRSKCMWVAGIGIIKMELLTWSSLEYELLRYKADPR